MSQPLTDAINALTTYANSVTGASDTTLSDAVDSLVAGYGRGGGGVATGSFTPSADTLTYGPIDTGTDFKRLVIHAGSNPYTGTGRTAFGVFVDFENKLNFIVSSNSAGSSVAGVYSLSFSGNSAGGVMKNGTSFSMSSNGSATGIFNYLKAGITYTWYAF